MWFGDGKWTVMSRRTSGNENKNKAAVYGKRHEGKSSGAAFESRVRNFSGSLWRGCHLPSFLPFLSVSGHCVRSLLLFPLGVTGTPPTELECLEVLTERCRCGA